MVSRPTPFPMAKNMFRYFLSSYIAIVYPFRPQLQTSHAKWIILLVWTIGLVVVIPYMLALELNGDSCQENFEAAGMVTWAYTIGVFIAQYIVPLTIIVVCYIRWVVLVFMRLNWW